MVDNLNRKLTMIVLALAAAIIAQFILPFRLGLDLSGGTRLTYSVDIDAARAAGTIDKGETDEKVMADLVAIWNKRVDPTGTRGVVIRKVGSNRVVIEIPGSASAVAKNVISSLAGELSAEAVSLVLDPNDAVNWERFPATGGVVRIDDEEIAYRERRSSGLLGLRRGQTNTTATNHSVGAKVELIAADPWKSLIENTGRMEFYIEAIDGDDLRPITDLNTERRLVEAWIDGNPGRPIADYNQELATRYTEANDPRGRLRWYPHQDKEGNLLAALGDDPEAARQAEVASLKRRLEPLIIDEKRLWHFSGADMSAVRQSFDKLGFPAVGFDIRSDRGNEFGLYTGFHKGNRMAIVINDEIVTMPEINDALYDGGIINGGDRGFRDEEVKGLIDVLRSGSLSISPQFESEESVGATLGHEYVRRGAISAVVALAAVVLFGIYYYRLLGVITAASLAVNLLLLLGAMRYLQATLTLPGIAGIVLTVGMAIDANILIFERMREELLKGRKPLQSAKDGFANALSTILDANITTFITGLILAWVGAGPVRAFAFILCIGIVTTLFSALLVTRVLIHFAFERGVEEFKMRRFVGETNFKFLAQARKCIAASLIAITLGLVIFGILPKHDKFGIEFIGGNTLTMVTRTPQSKADVTAAVQGIGPEYKDAVVQEIRSSSTAGGFTKFRVEFKSEQNQIGDGNIHRSTITRALKELLSRGPVELELTEGEASGALFFEQGHPTADLAAKLTTLGLTEAQVNPTAAEEGNAYTFTGRVATTVDAEGLRGRIVEAFADQPDSTGAKFSWERPIPQADAVSPQVMQELRDHAILAIILSLFAVVMYIRVRFAEYSYGLAAMAALVHDVLITIGVLGVAIHLDLVEAEINLNMIAAFLTIIGYSLNDTIVVFDRIRENLPKYNRPLAEVIDLSVNQTLSRTILTSATTMLAVVIMFAFNLGTRNALESFGFALIAGILVGTYSTVFIANPVLLWLETRRLAAGGAEVISKPSPVIDLP